MYQNLFIKHSIKKLFSITNFINFYHVSIYLFICDTKKYNTDAKILA